MAPHRPHYVHNKMIEAEGSDHSDALHGDAPNMNVLTDGVSQGDANNADTGQAAQQAAS